MIIIKDISDFKETNIVATIGLFDGVHRGHRYLIDELKKISKECKLPSAIITFAEAPRNVLHAGTELKMLNTFDEKLSHLAETGVDYCIVLQFTPELAKLTAKEFISDILADRLHVSILLIGYDHRFGHNREDGFTEYVKYAAEKNMKVIKASQFKENSHKVSSSEIRHLLQHGDVENAAILLEYPYAIQGTIVGGHQVGRQLGFPTANISLDNSQKLLPCSGVYAVKVIIDNRKYNGMLYIGKRPTLENGLNTTIEVNIFDFNEDIYGKKILVEFVKFIRGDKKFHTLDELKAQLNDDELTVKSILENNI